MCMISNIADTWGTKFPQDYPKVYPVPQVWPVEVSRAEFEALRNEIQELKKLLEAAKKFDAATGQPDCQMEEKVKLIRAIAKLVGVDLGDVLPT